MTSDKISREISSTEKLLRVIRSAPEDPLAEPGSWQPPGVSGRPKPVRPTFPVPFPGKIRIGVEVGSDELRMVKVSRRRDKRYDLLATRILPLADSRGTASDFSGWLKRSLDDFAGTGKSAQLWAAVPEWQVELRPIQIPKVPTSQIAEAVCRSIEQAAESDPPQTLLDYVVLAETQEEGVAKLTVLAQWAATRELESIQARFAEAGYPLTGISAVPSVLENLFHTGWLQSGTAPVVILQIGEERSGIHVFAEGRVRLSRVVRTGIASMAGAVRDGWWECRAESMTGLKGPGAGPIMDRRVPAGELNPARARQWIDELGQPGCARKAWADEDPWGREQVFEWVRPVLDRLIRQVERTLQYATATLGLEPAESFYLSGSLGACPRFCDYFKQQSGFAMEPLDPFAGVSVPETDPAAAVGQRERLSLTTAAGLALSDNRRTANSLFPPSARLRLAQGKRLRRMMLVGFLSVLMACLAGYRLAHHRWEEKRAALSRAEQALAAYQPRVDRSMILQLATEIQQKRQSAQRQVRYLMPLALVREVAAKTPDPIRLLRLDARLGSGPPEAKPPQEATLILEGIVSGERKTLQSKLAGYLLRLNGSSLFDLPSVTENSLETYEDLGEVLHFTAELKILQGTDGP